MLFLFFLGENIGIFHISYDLDPLMREMFKVPRQLKRRPIDLL